MNNLFKKLKTIWWREKSFLARYCYGNPSSKLKIVGVTGTSGKTTTVTLLYKIALKLGYRAGLVSTVENLANGKPLNSGGNGPGTTPDSVTLTKLFKKMANEGCEYVFMEVSSHAMDQNRVAGINFTGGIFTNLSQDHFDYHKNFENYFEAKKKFFRMLSKDAFALSNTDDKYGLRMLEGIKAHKTTYGLDGKVDFNDRLETKLIGNFNAYNVLAVYAAAVLLGWDKDKVKNVLKTVEPPRGRFEYFNALNGVTVIVDYAHKPDALQKVLDTINKIKKEGNRVISIFGCGGDRDTLKRPIMGKIGAENSDIAIFTSDNPRSEDPEKIIEEMKRDLSVNLLQKVKSISNRREAIAEAVRIAQKGDIIICAGKGHENYQDIKGVKHNFDDMEELKGALK